VITARFGRYAALAKERNDTAHTNGNIFFSTQKALDDKITEILRVVDEIQSHSKPVIEHCYREFLMENHDPDLRAYPDPADQIREILIHENYLSQKDIEICLGFDLASLGDAVPSEQARQLHDALVAKYGMDDERGEAPAIALDSVT